MHPGCHKGGGLGGLVSLVQPICQRGVESDGFFAGCTKSGCLDVVHAPHCDTDCEWHITGMRMRCRKSGLGMQESVEASRDWFVTCEAYAAGMAAQLAAHALQLTSFEAQQPLLYLINAVLFAGWGSWPAISRCNTLS